MRIFGFAILIACLPAFAQAQVADRVETDPPGIAREVLDELLAEDERASHFRDYQGHDIVFIGTRPRASRVGGLCERDVLIIERDREAPTIEGRGAIRELKVQRWFYVLADANKQPTWEVRNHDLERSCAAVHPDENRWFQADDANVAKSVVAGLFALRDELRRSRSRAIQWECLPMSCASASELADRIDPLDPSMASQANYRGCEPDRWCVRTLLDRPPCGALATDLMMDSSKIDSFRSARIGRSVGDLACGEEQVEREALGE